MFEATNFCPFGSGQKNRLEIHHTILPIPISNFIVLHLFSSFQLWWELNFELHTRNSFMTDALNFELHTRNSFMTDAQISQSGPLFPKISLLDAKCFDFARLAVTGRFWWWGCCPLFCPRCRSARWKFELCPYMIFPRQSSIVACQNLEGYVTFPRKLPKGMHRRCFRQYVHMLWHHRRTRFGDYLDWGLCAWWCTY